MKLPFLILLLVAISSCASKGPSPQRLAADKALDALAEEDAKRLDRAAVFVREASGRGPIIRDGYSRLQEGLTESQVDSIFQGIAYTPSQEICGQSSSGPVTCRVRKYYGLIDRNPIEARIVFSRSSSGDWAIIAWE